MLESFYVVFPNDDIVFVNEDSDFVTYFSGDMGLNILNFDNGNPEDDNFGEDDPESIIHVRVMALHNRCKQRKLF